MSGKELARQVAALPEAERESFIVELLTHNAAAEDLEDILLVRSRRQESSVSFDDVIASLKRDKLGRRRIAVKPQVENPIQKWRGRGKLPSGTGVDDYLAKIRG